MDIGGRDLYYPGGTRSQWEAAQAYFKKLWPNHKIEVMDDHAMADESHRAHLNAIEDHTKIKKGDVVFHYVHLVTAVQQKMGGMRFQISNNKNHTNGWVPETQVFGKVTKVEP